MTAETEPTSKPSQGSPAGDAIEVRYDWGAEREAALPQMAPVLLGELMPPPWLQCLVPALYLAVLFAGFGLGGPWVGLGLILVPLALAGVLWARGRFGEREPPPPQPFADAPAGPWLFTVNEERIEWRTGDRLVQTAPWADVVRCHRTSTGFVLSFAARSPLLPVWLPVQAFPGPEKVERFTELARRKTRLFTFV